MNEEAILELYNELSTDYEVGDIDQFKAYLQDPKSRVDFFEQIIKPVYAVEDIADFEAFYGLKKKDDTEFGLEGGSSELTPLSRNQQLGVTPTAEKDTAIERMFGKNEVTDFFGDLYRSGVQGQAQGATVDDALNLFAKGQDISDEDLKEYIESVRNMESFGPSEEMQDFTKIYEKNGKGLWGFLSGVAQNPTVIPQLFTSSVSAMFNKGSIAGGVAGAVTGGVGAGLATGGIAAIPGALIGGIGGVSGALETGLSYTEFLKEELDKEGLSFDEDNVKKILLNEEAMNSIKNKALARGLTIAAIDAFSGGLATSITRKTATKLGSKLAGAAAGGTVEALGGATGEAAARLVAGQEMDIAEIGFEGVAGTATAPLTIGAGLMKPPSYSMNGGKASRKDIQTLLSTGTPEQIAAVKISVKNDSDLYKEAQTKKSDIMLLAEIETANPGITEKDKAELLVLEKARQTLENSSIKSAKNNLKLIDEKIDVISKRYLPTEKEILTKKEKDAVQESSAEGVVLREQARDGEGVGVKDSKPAEKITPQEETVAPTDQEIAEEADVTELTEDEKLKKVTKEKVKKLVTAPRRITEPFKIGRTTITLNEDGTIKSAVNSKGVPVKEAALKKVQKKVLESLIDIDSGEKATVVEGITEQEAPGYIAENSNNVREIAETIQSEETRIKEANELAEKIKTEDEGLFSLTNLAFTPESWEAVNGNPPSENISSSKWIRTKEKGGLNLEDGVNGITPKEIEKFILDNPTAADVIQTTGEVTNKNDLISLQEKFESLTGIAPTTSIVDFVVGIEQGRVPLDLLKSLEKEQLTRQAAEPVVFGKKRGPSAKKITSTPKKEVTVDEAKALTDQIKLEAKAAREAKLDIKKKRAQINEVIKGIKSKAQITATQAGVLTRKINSLNVDNDTKVKEFLEYAEKIVRNAELAEKIKRADALRKTAKKNIIKGKIGTAKDLFPALESLFNINIQAIPLEKIDSYLELAEAFGERKSVLTLPEKGLALQQAEDILNSIEDEAQVADDVEVKEDDYNLQKEIDNIVNNRIEVPTLIEPEKVIADYLNSLSKEDIEGLVTEKDGKKNYSQVEKLKNVLSNIENGYVPKAASELAINIEASRKNKIISPVIGKLKFNVLEQGIEKAIAKAKAGLKSRKRDVIGKQIGAAPLTNIDEALGNFNKKDIARETFDYLASEYSKYEVALGKIDNILSEAEALLTQGKRGKFSKRLLNQSIKAKYKIMAYQLQREFVSNNGKKGTAPALDFINATVDAIKSEEQNFLKDNDVKILEEIKKEFIADGKIDNDKILNSLSPREKKALELIDQANQSLAEKALFTSGVLRGNRVNLFSNYVHHDVIMKNQEDVESMLKDKRERMTKPSTKSKTLLERTPGAKPISFDPISSAGRAAKETLLDFHMTQPIRIVNKTLSNVIETIESDPNSTKLQRGTAKAIKDAFEEINSIIFDNTYQEIGVADKFLDKAKKLGYYAALASLPRAGAELGSNLSFALLSNPQGLAAGIKNYGKYSMGAEGAEVLDAIGSSQTLKLYNKEALTGKLADTNLYERGKDKRGKAVNPVSETINYLYNNLPIIKGPVEATRVISENLISTPDKAISRPLYFDTFVRAFAEATKKSGKEIKLTSKDFKNIEDYVAKYPDEIKEAREKADDENIRMATTVNPYSGILKLQPKKGDSTINKIYKQANGYMARFTLFEYSTFRKAVRALYTDGEISKKQGAGLIAGSVARMTSYMILYQFLSNMFDTVMGGIFGLDVEEEEDGLENQLMRQLVGTGSTLILRRSVGNVPAIPISLLIEYLNEQYGEDLRSGEEYDEFENSLVFSQIGLNELRKGKVEVIGTKALLGPYTPLARSVSRGVKVVQGLTGSAKEETKQKYMDELTLRMAIEAAGNLGLLPFYKDVRRILLKDMFKDKPKTSGKGSKYTEKDFKNAKGNPAKQRFIRQKINSQKNTNKKFSKRSIPGTKK
jgi:hypothetical protein